MRRKFTDGGGRDLPIGAHEPCQLLSITRHEPSEDSLKRWPDMRPSLAFRFMLYKPEDPELHGATGIRFVSDSMSKLGKLFELCTDLRDGNPPDDFDEDDYVNRWYRCTVRKKPGSEKLYVASASPIDAPKGVPRDWHKPVSLERARRAGDADEDEDDEQFAGVADEDDDCGF